MAATMRKTAEWMVSADERILECLMDAGNLTPIAISREGKIPRVPISGSYASRRCTALHKHGLITEIDNNLYTINEVGLAFLAGWLDAGELDERDENDR